MKTFFLFLFSSSFCWAQKAYQYRAGTLEDGVKVYKEANFDSPVIATLPGGKIYDVSSKLFQGAFYRIRVKPGLIGYIADVDVKPLFPTDPKKADLKKNEKQALQKQGKDEKSERSEKTDKNEEPKKRKPFEFSRYVGPEYALIQFQEQTMGDRRKETLGFYGIKLSGSNLMVDGYLPTDVNFLFYPGAPKYYEKLTGQASEGWIFLMDFLWQSYFPQGRNALTFLGFGPMFKYSRFNVSLMDPATSKVTTYSAQDMSLGAVFNAGVALRWNSVALRGELQYYWEKEAYLGTGFALQFNF